MARHDFQPLVASLALWLGPEILKDFQRDTISTFSRTPVSMIGARSTRPSIFDMTLREHKCLTKKHPASHQDG